MKTRVTRAWGASWAVLMGVGVPIALGGPGTFTILPPPAGGWSNVDPVGVSGDGGVVAALVDGVGTDRRAMRWTRAAGSVLSPAPMQATAISPDGRIIYGSLTVPTAPTGFNGFAMRWMENSVASFIGPTASTFWRPSASSEDGRVVVLTGLEVGPINTIRVGRIWTDGGPPIAQPGRDWTVYDVSNNGLTIVGQSGPTTLFGGDARLYRPYRRDLLGTAFEDFTTPSGEDAHGEAFGVSPDGGTITGRLALGNPLGTRRAFMWNESDGTRYLASLSDGTSGTPRSISRNGVRIVGEDAGMSGLTAVLWEGGAVMELGSVLRGQRAPLPVDARLDRAVAISDDGRAVVGQGVDAGGQRFAFLATFGTPCVADQDDGTGAGISDDGVTVDDLIYFLAQYAMGAARADLDDGTGGGIPDGGVTIDDLLYYLARYAAGC